MVALPGFIVICHQPGATMAIEQTVFEAVAGPAHRGGDLPELHLQDRAVIVEALAVVEEDGIGHGEL